MTVEKLFATPVQITELDMLDNIHNIVKDKCLELKTESAGRTLSNVGGWQSQNLGPDDLNNPQFRELFFNITKEVNNFFKVLGLRDEAYLYNTWININNQDAYNSSHTHPNSIVSGVYYVAVPENSGGLVLTRPSDVMSWFYSSYAKDFNDISNNNVIHTPKEKELVLFPSWLPHSVLPNNTEEDRISISFNFNTKYFKFGT